jgi:histidinol-phosphate aminotransferase
LNDETLHFEAAINPYGCSESVVLAMETCARAKQYRSYGEPTAESLRQSLANHYGLSPDNFVVFNGAGEALAWLFVLNLVRRRGRLIVPYPSYERFVEAGKRCAAEVIEVPLDEETFSLPVDQFIEDGRGRANVGLISSPNNPTGNLLLDEKSMSRLLYEMPDCLWIIDEAYADYADYAGVSFVPWVRERRNLVVLRSFSKAYGLAGLRVGYAVAHPSVAGELAGVRLPWCVNSLSLVAAQAALLDQEYLARVVARIKADCEEFQAGLSRIPFLHVYPSAANFFLVRLEGVSPSSVKQQLAERRIEVRSRADMPLHIRLTSLRPSENQRLLDALESFKG